MPEQPDGEEEEEQEQKGYEEEEEGWLGFENESHAHRIHTLKEASKYDCIAVLLSMRQFMDDLYSDPPADMRGQLLTAQREGWNEIRETVDEIASRLGVLPIESFRAVGLVGKAGAAKFRQWVSARFDFSDLRNSRRAARVLHVGANIAGSVAGLVNADEPVKEAFEAAKYIADMAVDETSK